MAGIATVSGADERPAQVLALLGARGAVGRCIGILLAGQHALVIGQVEVGVASSIAAACTSTSRARRLAQMICCPSGSVYPGAQLVIGHASRRSP